MRELLAPPLQGLLQLVFRLAVLFIALPFATGLLAGLMDYFLSRLSRGPAGTPAANPHSNPRERTLSQTRGGR